MRSTFGECRGNVRSTPTPNDCLRTVKVSRTPPPWRFITTPSNTWVRLRLPSMTWKWTLTRSPAWNTGTRRRCVRSRLSMTPLIANGGRLRQKEARRLGRDARAVMVARRRSRLLRPRRLLAASRRRSASAAADPIAAPSQAPLTDLGVVPREENLRDGVPAPLRGTRVVGVLGGPGERLAERLLHRALLVSQGSRELAQDGVAHDHGGQLAPGEHIGADGDDVRGQVLVNPLVESLVAAAE